MSTKLTNRFFKLVFLDGVWTELYNLQNSPTRNMIVSATNEPMMLKVKKNVTKNTVTNYGVPGVQSKCYNVTSGSFWITDEESWQYDQTKQEDNVVRIHYHNSWFKLTINYRLDESEPLIERSLKLEYTGTEKIYLHDALPTSPMFHNGTGDDDIEVEIYDTRNNLSGLRHKLGNMQFLKGERHPGRDHNITAMDCDINHEVSALMFNQSANNVFAIWGYSKQNEAVAYTAEENAGGLRFDQTFWAFADLQETPIVECGSQFIRYYEACNWEKAIDGLIAMKPEHGYITPVLPLEIKSGLIYQVHGGIADFGGFSGLEKRLDTLLELGVKTLYLPPLAGPSAYLNYTPDQVAPCFGTEEELCSLVNQAHAREMYVIVDMIAHDAFRHGPVIDHKDFIRYDELGEPITYALGTILTETGNKEFQGYYIDCCKKLREEFHVDGFRFDVSGFQMPNWQNVDTRGDERSGMGVCGQTELLEKLRRKLGDDTILLEEGMGVQGFRYISHGWIQVIKRLRNYSRREQEPLHVLLDRIKLLLADRGTCHKQISTK